MLLDTSKTTNNGGRHNPLTTSDTDWHPAETVETSAHATAFTAAPSTLYTSPVCKKPYVNVLTMNKGDGVFTLQEEPHRSIHATTPARCPNSSMMTSPTQQKNRSYEEDGHGAPGEITQEMVEWAKFLTNDVGYTPQSSLSERLPRKPKRTPRPKRRRSPVPFVGVSKKSPNSFEVKIRDKGRTNYIGTFPNAEQAACAYDTTVVRLRGRERALVNFPAKFGLPVDQKAIKIGRRCQTMLDGTQGSAEHNGTAIPCEGRPKRFKLSD